MIINATYQNIIFFLACNIFFMSVFYIGQEGVIFLNSSPSVCWCRTDWKVQEAWSQFLISGVKMLLLKSAPDGNAGSSPLQGRWIVLHIWILYNLYCKNFVTHIQQQHNQHCFVLTLAFVHIWVCMLDLVAKLSLSNMTVDAFLVIVRFEESTHSNSSH